MCRVEQMLKENKMFDEYYSKGDKFMMLCVIIMMIAIAVFVGTGVGALFTLLFGVFSTKTVLLFSAGTAVVAWLLAQAIVSFEWR